jgi:hypothetical protein
MYNIPHGAPKWGEIRFFGDYCPKCGTFNSHINKNSIISFIIFIAIIAVLYLIGIL